MAAAMDVDTPSGTNSGAGKKRFEVKKWNAVALWAWDIVVDNCAICRNHIMDLFMRDRRPFNIDRNLPVLLKCEDCGTPQNNSRHRMSSKSSISYLRRVHSCMGCLQSCFPLPLHLSLAQDSPSMSTGQQGMGVPKVWTLERWSPRFLLRRQPQLFLSLWVCFSNLKNQ